MNLIEIKSRIELITPERARDLLINNLENRPVSKVNVDRIANAISKGEWKINGDAISVCKDGTLLDGQHRLHAIVKTGIPIESFVIEGLDKEVFTTIDQGRKRNVSDVLSTKNVKNSKIIASTMSIIIPYKKGSDPKNANSNKVTMSEFLKYYEYNSKMLNDSALFVTANKLLAQWFSPSYLSFLYFILSEKNELDCLVFFNSLKTGELLNKQNQPLILREKIIQNLSVPLNKKESPYYLSAYCIYAWNAFRQNRQIKLLKFNNNNDFPAPI